MSSHLNRNPLQKATGKSGFSLDRERKEGESRYNQKKRQWKQKNKEKSPDRAHGVKNWGSSHKDQNKNQSYSTASRPYQTRNQKTTPFNVFTEHRSLTNTDIQFCGFYWHSTRIASKGTNDIFNTLKQSFQSRAINGKITWDGVREILFEQKKTLDQYYRNMMYHFRLGEKCERCCYWDDVYKKHLANIPTTSVSTEISDSEMLEVALSFDATNK